MPAGTLRASAVVWASCAACVVLPFVSTGSFGAAVDNDSVDFFSAAESLMAGGKYVTAANIPFALWPPLNPAVYAPLRVLGLEYPDAALLVNAISWLAVVWFGARLVYRIGGSPVASALSAAALVVSPDMLWTYTQALSEPLFIALLVVSAYALCRYVERPSRAWFAVFTIGAGLACLQRYLGVTFVVSTGLVLLFHPRRPHRDGWSVRLGRAVTFGVLASLPLLGWVVRNIAVTDSLTGPGRASWGSGLHQGATLYDFGRTVVRWFAPDRIRPSPLLVVPGLLIVGSIAALALVPMKGREGRRELARTYATFPVVYLVVVLVLNLGMSIDGLGSRQLVPALPFVWGLVLLGLVRAVGRVEGRGPGPRRIAVGLLVLLSALYAQRAAGRMGTLARTWRNNGPGVYNNRAAESLEVLAWLRQNPVEDPIFSNDHHAVYYHAGLKASRLPMRRPEFRAFGRERAAEGGRAHLVWLRHNDRTILPIDAMSRWLEVRTLAEFPDGEVYELEPRQR